MILEMFPGPQTLLAMQTMASRMNSCISTHIQFSNPQGQNSNNNNNNKNNKRKITIIFSKKKKKKKKKKKSKFKPRGQKVWFFLKKTKILRFTITLNVNSINRNKRNNNKNYNKNFNNKIYNDYYFHICETQGHSTDHCKYNLLIKENNKSDDNNNKSYKTVNSKNKNSSKGYSKNNINNLNNFK